MNIVRQSARSTFSEDAFFTIFNNSTSKEHERTLDTEFVNWKTMSAQTQQKVPLTKEKNPVAVAIANAVRYNKELKQRQGILASSKNKVDFFRYKRFIRAIQSDDYKKKQEKSKLIPPVPVDVSGINQIFVMLIQNQMIVPVDKMKTKDSKAQGLAIDKKTPGLQQSTKAVLQDDVYYMWAYTPPNPFMILYSILAIVAVFAVILFPLWPFWMRKGVWYVSTSLLVFLGLFFAIAIVRLIIYLITLATMTEQFWLFPNLFEDCGVIESFKPLYGWEDPKKKKAKKSKKSKIATNSTTTNSTVDSQTKTNPVEAETTSAEPVKTATSTKQRNVTLEEVEE